MRVQEIENAIKQLSIEDLNALTNWLDEYRAELWDEQIKADVEAGRLDELLAEVDAEYEAGLAQPL